MVGDDPINDMVAKKLGIKTFLATDNIKSKGQLRVISEKIRFGFSFKKTRVDPDYSGPLIELPEILATLI